MFLEAYVEYAELVAIQVLLSSKNSRFKAQNGGPSKPTVLCRMFAIYMASYGCYRLVLLKRVSGISRFCIRFPKTNKEKMYDKRKSSCKKEHL